MSYERLGTTWSILFSEGVLSIFWGVPKDPDMLYRYRLFIVIPKIWESRLDLSA